MLFYLRHCSKCVSVWREGNDATIWGSAIVAVAERASAEHHWLSRVARLLLLYWAGILFQSNLAIGRQFVINSPRIVSIWTLSRRVVWSLFRKGQQRCASANFYAFYAHTWWWPCHLYFHHFLWPALKFYLLGVCFLYHPLVAVIELWPPGAWHQYNLQRQSRNLVDEAPPCEPSLRIC